MPAWPSPAVGGARLITVKLPVTPLLGGSEPLLVTGQTKAAEIVFVKYPDAEHLQIGYEKWGIGGQVSGPIPVRAGQAREIEVSLGSLYGAGVFPLETAEAEVMRRLRETVLVLLDGRVVLKQVSESFPAGNEQIRGGRERGRGPRRARRNSRGKFYGRSSWGRQSCREACSISRWLTLDRPFPLTLFP